MIKRQKTCRVITSLTICNLLNVTKCSFLNDDWLIKKSFFHQWWYCNLQFLHLDYKKCVWCSICNVCKLFNNFFFPENLDQVRYLNIGFFPALFLLIDIYSSWLCVRILVLNVILVLYYLELVMLELKHKVFLSVITYVVFLFVSQITQFAEQVEIRLILKSVNSKNL